MATKKTKTTTKATTFSKLIAELRTKFEGSDADYSTKKLLEKTIFKLEESEKLVSILKKIKVGKSPNYKPRNEKAEAKTDQEQE